LPPDPRNRAVFGGHAASGEASPYKVTTENAIHRVDPAMRRSS
jgi:hypothetical protein